MSCQSAHLNTTGASGWSSQVDTHYSERAPADTACLASTICRHRAHPQAACSLDPRPHSVLRRRWWTSRTPKDLHQRRQAPDLLVHILRTAICKFLLQLCVLELPVLAQSTSGQLLTFLQAHEKHRPLLEATPEHELSYPLGPKGDAAEVSETQQVTDEPLAQR
jgi:hypothetical protein